MVVHAAFGGSTNLLLHLPAIAHAAGLRRPVMEDWAAVNRAVPRLVDVLPNGPTGYATVQVFLAGGVPEVMLHLRELGLLRLDARTVQGGTLGEALRALGEQRTARAPARPAVRAGRGGPGRRDPQPGARARARPDQHGGLPARQPGPAGRDRQEHRHRPQRGRRGRGLPQDRPGAGLHQRARLPSPPSRARAARPSGPAT